MFRVSSHPGSSSKWEHLLNSSCLYVYGIFLHVSHSIIRANRRLPPSFVCRICVHLCASPSLHCHYMTTESTGNPISAVWGTFKYRFPFFTSPNSVLSSSVCLFVCVCVGFVFAYSETMSTEQRLLSIPELSHHLAESYLTCCLYLQEMLQYKHQNHGKVQCFDSSHWNTRKNRYTNWEQQGSYAVWTSVEFVFSDFQVWISMDERKTEKMEKYVFPDY